MPLRATLLLALLAACSGSPAERYAGPYRHVVLVSLDTVRRDALGCYGGAAPTPTLDALVRDGVRFDAAWTCAPTTLASHASIFTGSHSHTHGVPRNSFVLDLANLTLAEVLREHGFHTAAFLGSFALDARFGIAQGFDHWDQRFGVLVEAGKVDQDQRSAHDVTNATLAHVDEIEREFGVDRRLFLFCHYFDAHAPYEPGPEDLELVGGGEQALTGADLETISHAVAAHHRNWTGRARSYDDLVQNGLTREVIALADGTPIAPDEEIARLYQGEIPAIDRELGRLFDGLRARGVLDDAIVIVLADHGESFWEHADVWNHGLACYGSTLDVPLIVRLPAGGSATTGIRVDVPVSTADVAPTLLELLGFELAPSDLERVDGRSLVPALRGEALPTIPIFAEATQPFLLSAERASAWKNTFKARAVRSGRWKLITTPYLELEELFDLVDDPQERRNLLLDPRPEVIARRNELHALVEAWDRDAPVLPTRFESSQIEETRARLRRLGYGGTDED